MSGGLYEVTSVPHPSDLWTFGSTGQGATFRNFAARRHDGHWKPLKAPSLGGQYGQINVIDAGSSGSIWLGGNREVANYQDQPAMCTRPVAASTLSARRLVVSLRSRSRLQRGPGARSRVSSATSNQSRPPRLCCAATSFERRAKAASRRS
jgi:hypothetical protein